jgi:hypothetical protein
MAWTNSKIFRLTLAEMFRNTAAYDLDTDSFKVALYNNSVTPDNDVTTNVLTQYNGAASQWVVANEVAEAGTWPSTGVALASPTIDSTTTADVVFWDATDTASSAGADLANVYGCLVYDTTVTSTGICYNYFGGANSVTNGTFTVVWNANGIFRVTL